MCCDEATGQVRKSFLDLVRAIATQNSLIRARYHHADKTHKEFEGTFFRVFCDVPVQLHVFLDEVERGRPAEDQLAFSQLVSEVAKEARKRAGDPKRDRRGRLKWARSVPFEGFYLADEIELLA